MGRNAYERPVLHLVTGKIPLRTGERFYTLDLVPLCPVTWRSQCCSPGEPATRGDCDIYIFLIIFFPDTVVLQVLARWEEWQCWFCPGLARGVLAPAVQRCLWAVREAVKSCKHMTRVILFPSWQQSTVCFLVPKVRASQIWPKGAITTKIWFACWVCIF